ncbi:MAG: ABC transporter ATP-binding protein [Clostridia bacterium]|nr:ABC transporter ATP-binding protein [Clostridia bacterium]
MIEFLHVHKTYGKSGKAALTDLTLTVPDGCVYGFLGPNGAGKTTAIRLMTGVLKPTEGSIRVNGVSVAEDPVTVKRSIGFVPDSQDMYDRLTGWEYISFMADIFGVSEKERKEAAEKYLAMFELESAAGQRIQGYSRGMKQKLNIIGALVHNPPVWVLDEPMVGLDPKAAHLLKTEMRERADAGATVFFSTHVLEVAERLCDRVGIIQTGRLITEGTPESLLKGTNESLEDFFLELTEKEEAEEA